MNPFKLRPATGVAACFVTSLALVVESCVLPDFQEGTLPTHDAGPVEAGPPACGKTYPDPPGGKDPELKTSHVLAMRAIDMGEGSPTPPGYDLDGKCTCVGDGGPTCVSETAHCDAPEGVDNQGSVLMNMLAYGLPAFGSSYFSAKAEMGGWSLLIELDDYSGGADDPAVKVTLYPSPGVVTAPPGWKGNDTWRVSSTAFSSTGEPLYVSLGAYVSGHVLVAALPQAEITIAGDGKQTITIKVSAGFLTGTLTKLGEHYQIMDGILAARWAVKDIFAAVSSYRGDDGSPICTNNWIYASARGQVCDTLDILVNASNPKSMPCDAVSLGMSFKAAPAELGPTEAPPIPSPGCSPETDPAYDSCEGVPVVDAGADAGL